MTKQKPWSAKNISDLWTVKSKKGTMVLAWMGYEKNDAIQNFRKAIKTEKSWKQLYRLGYRAVKIRIVEME